MRGAAVLPARGPIFHNLDHDHACLVTCLCNRGGVDAERDGWGGEVAVFISVGWAGTVGAETVAQRGLTHD